MTADFHELFRRARDGDSAAQGELLERHYDALHAFVRLQCGQLVQALEASTDVVQSVCRDALQDLAELDCEDEKAFRHWLCRVAVNKIIKKKDFHTAAKRDAAKRVPLASSPGAVQTLLASYGKVCSPSQDAAATEEVQRIESAFAQMPEEYRDVIVQARLLGRSHREIAEQMDKNEPAVRKLLARARARLAVLLAESD